MVLCNLLLCACGEKHEHTYSSEWTYGEAYHWHKATCEHESEISGFAAHNFVGNTCSVCGYEKKQAGGSETSEKHTHALTLTKAKGATCTKDGNKAYYICVGCGKWFSDGGGKNEITDKTSVVLPKGHTLTLTKEKDATCTEDGNKAYYICGSCNKWFLDGGGKNEITDKTDVVLPKGHKYVNDVCSVCGKGPTEGLEYADKGEYYEVSGLGTATKTDIIIPSVYNGKPVTSIGDSAFKGCKSLTSIDIPDRESISDLHPTNSY